MFWKARGLPVIWLKGFSKFFMTTSDNFRNTYGLAVPIIFLLLTILPNVCQSQISDQMAASSPMVQVKGRHFVDQRGREVILNGINVVSKSKQDNYLFQSGPEFYSDLKDWGINTLRFIVIWDGIEPMPDHYDESYLQELDQKISWATSQGLFVVLDLHQDLFSSRFSDGAPAWATLDGGAPHVSGEVWSDSYLISPAVHQAFDSFWDNKPAADGKGLQDHLVEIWQLLSKRYQDNPYVIGYDLFNEPFLGSVAKNAMPKLLQAYGQLHFENTGETLSEEQLQELWMEPQTRAETLRSMSDAKSFSKVIDSLYPITSQFEREKLQPFYQKVAHAIRETGDKKIIFLEHTYFSNMGVRTEIQRTMLPNGEPDPQVAYAPHAYDLVVDTDFSGESSVERMDFIYKRIYEKGEELQMPVWLGEWGAYYRAGEEIVPLAREAMTLLQKYLFHNAYWSYDPGLESLPYFQDALRIPYPQAIAGRLISYSFDYDQQILQVKWEADSQVKSKSVIYIPDVTRIDLDEISRQGFELEKNEHGESGLLLIPYSTDVVQVTIPFNSN